MYGVIFVICNWDVYIYGVCVENVLYFGIWGYLVSELKIFDCEFVGVGGKWSCGELGIDGGILGGVIFMIWLFEFEIVYNCFEFGLWNRCFGKLGGYYGIKGWGGRDIWIYYNFIGLNFFIEFFFEGNIGMEIDYNIL